MQWGWNHNPDATKWSLSKSPGRLRLMTATVTNDFTMARNTLTQRSFAKRDQTIPTIATTKMDVRKMKDGDIAGLAVFQDPYAYIAVKQPAYRTGRQKEKKYILMLNNGKVIDSAIINASTVYLRTLASNATGKASFEYSIDNKNFKPIGEDFMMRFSLKIFTGNKFCLFNYATKEEGGYVDFDWFKVD